MRKYMAEQDAGIREKVSHGDIFLPVSSYHCLVPLTYQELAIHWHEEMEITLIREGSSNYRVGQSRFRTEAGDLILGPPYCLHSAFEIAGQKMVSDSLVFHPDFLGAGGADLSALKYLRPLAEGRLSAQPVIRAGEEGYEEIREGFLQALAVFLEKEPYYELELREKLLRVLLLLFRCGYIRESGESRHSQESRQQLIAVLQYIGEHYTEKLQIGELASRSGFSESHFMNLFRKHVGMTCTQYMNRYRIRKAAEALEETEAPVMEIAMDHGFDNISYFNLQFRREFGMTPGQFRKRQAGMEAV